MASRHPIGSEGAAVDTKRKDNNKNNVPTAASDGTSPYLSASAISVATTPRATIAPLANAPITIDRKYQSDDAAQQLLFTEGALTYNRLGFTTQTTMATTAATATAAAANEKAAASAATEKPPNPTVMANSNSKLILITAKQHPSVTPATMFNKLNIKAQHAYELILFDAPYKLLKKGHLEQRKLKNKLHLGYSASEIKTLATQKELLKFHASIRLRLFYIQQLELIAIDKYEDLAIPTISSINTFDTDGIESYVNTRKKLADLLIIQKLFFNAEISAKPNPKVSELIAHKKTNNESIEIIDWLQHTALNNVTKNTLATILNARILAGKTILKLLVEISQCSREKAELQNKKEPNLEHIKQKDNELKTLRDNLQSHIPPGLDFDSLFYASLGQSKAELETNDCCKIC